MVVKIHTQSDVLIDSVPANWWSPIQTEWFGAAVAPAPEYAIGLSTEHLLFAGRRASKPVTVGSAHLGECVEGLWKFDAAELFIRNAAGPQYLEINLGPQSAWWLGVFSDYRIADVSFTQPVLEKIKPVLTWSDIREESWAAGVIFARKDLPFPIDEKQFLANPTFCLSEPSRLFLSAQKLPSAQPDFHKLAEIGQAKIISE